MTGKVTGGGPLDNQPKQSAIKTGVQRTSEFLGKVKALSLEAKDKLRSAFQRSDKAPTNKTDKKLSASAGPVKKDGRATRVLHTLTFKVFKKEEAKFHPGLEVKRQIAANQARRLEEAAAKNAAAERPVEEPAVDTTPPAEVLPKGIKPTLEQIQSKRRADYTANKQETGLRLSEKNAREIAYYESNWQKMTPDKRSAQLEKLGELINARQRTVELIQKDIDKLNINPEQWRLGLSEAKAKFGDQIAREKTLVHHYQQLTAILQGGKKEDVPELDLKGPEPAASPKTTSDKSAVKLTADELIAQRKEQYIGQRQEKARLLEERISKELATLEVKLPGMGPAEKQTELNRLNRQLDSRAMNLQLLQKEMTESLIDPAGNERPGAAEARGKYEDKMQDEQKLIDHYKDLLARVQSSMVE